MAHMCVYVNYLKKIVKIKLIENQRFGNKFIWNKFKNSFECLFREMHR